MQTGNDAVNVHVLSPHQLSEPILLCTLLHSAANTKAQPHCCTNAASAAALAGRNVTPLEK